ncbi:hypothetical protein CB1_000692030 [Camelus ferus]|nr:hypothetical protein CB1_000692030 [Camelus ferus]
MLQSRFSEVQALPAVMHLAHAAQPAVTHGKQQRSTARGTLTLGPAAYLERFRSAWFRTTGADSSPAPGSGRGLRKGTLRRLSSLCPLWEVETSRFHLSPDAFVPCSAAFCGSPLFLHTISMGRIACNR